MRAANGSSSKRGLGRRCTCVPPSPASTWLRVLAAAQEEESRVSLKLVIEASRPAREQQMCVPWLKVRELACPDPRAVRTHHSVRMRIRLDLP
jgi:hypothetical protein